jgi:hypothetical protein
MSRPLGHPVQSAPAAAATRWAARLAEAPPAGALPEGSAQRQRKETPIVQTATFWSVSSSRQNVTAYPMFPMAEYAVKEKAPAVCRGLKVASVDSNHASCVMRHASCVMRERVARRSGSSAGHHNGVGRRSDRGASIFSASRRLRPVGICCIRLLRPCRANSGRIRLVCGITGHGRAAPRCGIRHLLTAGLGAGDSLGADIASTII